MSDSWHENVKSKNRNEIIAAGKSLFLKHNFFNVNIKDVCDLAGISRVTFYKHFKTIDEVIFEVQVDILNSMTGYIQARDDEKASGIDRIRAILYAWIDFAKEYKDYMKFITQFDLYYENYDLNEDLKLKFREFVSKRSDKYFLNSAIVNGINDKTLRPDLDTTKTGYYIFQTIMGVLQRMSCSQLPDNPSNITFDDITEAVVEMIINSIINPSL